MGRMIAGIYEIEEKLGAGGGGIVYLGRHVRLDKKIVLKADKRKLSVGTEALRREVDLLKGLSHTYIPQVYDFVQEDGNVYTVMDYVEGESLDKLLARGQAISQKEIVKWACQLLEALSYLHNQKPNGILHGDIKPANIMLRPNGDICLIDFNIALALGEDGAVKVGYSRGYASPEHYGSEGAIANPLSGTWNGNNGNSAARQSSGIRSDTEYLGTSLVDGSSSGQSSSSSRKRLLLDVRSDIYSLGATLYHLLSGQRPAQKAVDVVPLEGCCRPEIAAIVQKAMNPNSDKRYQSAEEMLDAFLCLRTMDRRIVRNKKRFVLSAAASFALFLLGGACAFTGMKQRENYQAALTLASYSEASLGDGDIGAALAQAMQALDTGKGGFKAPIPAEAQKALTDALGVYDLSDGFKADGIVALPAAPFSLEVSPEGTRYAVVYAYEAAVYSVDGGEGMEAMEAIAKRKVRKSALSDCLFLDENTIVYAGEQGVEAYDLAAGTVLWTGEAATTLALSGDRSVLAAIDRGKDYAVIYDTENGTKVRECSFAGRQLPEPVNDLYVDRANYIFALDNTGAWLAVSFSNGGLSVFDTTDQENELILYDTSDYDVFSGGFCGKLFAFAAQGAEMNFFGVLDTENVELLGSWESRDKLLVQTDEGGICLSDGNLLARFAANTLEEKELAYTEGNTIQGFDVGDGFSMVMTEDNTLSFYDRKAKLSSQIAYEERHDFVKLADGYALVANREEPLVRILRLEEHKAAQSFSYDASYAHDEARVSEDGKTVMLFNYQGFQTYNSDGSLIAKCKLPDAEHIYDQQYIRDKGDSYLEVTWYDGMVRQYGVDGTLLAEEQQAAPDKEMEEEFLTEQYRIVSKLHKPPQVYERKTGKLLAQLEPDAELAYVTQLDGYIMTEYVSTTLERYGILLDENLQKLAYLPCLCDVYGNTVVFDYQNGNIRSCSIYSLDELVALGNGHEMNMR